MKFRKFSRKARASRIVRVGAIAILLGHRTQHHRTFRPGISILRKRRTGPFPRYRRPSSSPSRSYAGYTKGRISDNFITAWRSRSHLRLGGGRRCELLLKSYPRRRLREGCQLLVNVHSVRTRRLTRVACVPPCYKLNETLLFRVYKQVPN